MKCKFLFSQRHKPYNVVHPCWHRYALPSQHLAHVLTWYDCNVSKAPIENFSALARKHFVEVIRIMSSWFYVERNFHSFPIYDKYFINKIHELFFLLSSTTTRSLSLAAHIISIHSTLSLFLAMSMYFCIKAKKSGNKGICMYIGSDFRKEKNHFPQELERERVREISWIWGFVAVERASEREREMGRGCKSLANVAAVMSVFIKK